MNMHPGGPGQPPPGPPHHFPPHPHHHPYPGDPSQGYPPPGVPHHLMQPHPGPHPGDEHMDDGMHDPDESDHQLGEGGVEGGPPKRKRRRQALSCTECKRRKIRCDRSNPCQPCVRRGEGDKCKWHIIEPIDRPHQSEKFVTRAEYDDLRAKFDALEHAVAQMTGRPPSNIYQSHMGGPWGMPPMAEQDNGSGSARSPSLVVDPNLQVADAGPSSTTNANVSSESKKLGAQMLNAGERGEHLRHQLHPQSTTATTTIPTTTMPMFQGPNPVGAMLTSPGILMPPIPAPMRTLPILPNLHPDNWSQLGGAASPGMILGLAAVCPPYSTQPPKQTGDGKGSASLPGALPFATPLSMSNGYWVSGLPPRHMCEAIVDYYFRYVSWSHAIVLRSGIENNLKSFWTLPNDAASSAWVALYFMVLYHGVSNMDPEDPEHAAILSNSLQDWRRSCQTFWHGAQFALSQCDLAAPKEVETVQALTLLAFVYLSLDVKGWQAFAPTLAFIIRIAQNMGMSQLGKDVVGEQPKPGLRDRELQRRLWWSLVTLDWQYAAHLNNTYCVHPNQFDTAMPSNVDLDDLDEAEVFKDKPESVHTSASLLRAKCKIAERTRELASENLENGEINFVSLVKYDQDVANTYARLPSFLVARNDGLEKQTPAIMWERASLTIGIHSSALALHRTRFIHDFFDAKYSQAVATSIASADKVLQALKEFQTANFPGRKWWGVLLHCYKACVTLLLDSEHKRRLQPNPELASSRVELIQMVISLLEEGAEVIVFARKASLVLQHLLDEARAPAQLKPGRLSPLKRPRESGMDLDGDHAHSATNGPNGTTVEEELGIWDNIFELELDVEVMEERPQTTTTSRSYPAPASAERDHTRKTTEWS